MPFDDAGNRSRVEALQRRGVDVWGPERVYVSADVRLDAIEAGAVIRQATLSGAGLRIAKGAKIGVSGHAEVDDCQIATDVELGAGLYQGATFLHGAKVRGFAEIRPGTLLEEEAEAAHSVALKNTTFTSCCVAGSLINFCDLFLSGGTSRRDHTEIGSGAIHFNFDPRGDKWGSLIGGIRGVLLRSAPVFVGGNCGIVGPVEIGFGSVTAAGAVIRRDVGANVVIATGSKNVQIRDFDRRIYGSLTSRFLLTAKLIGTLRALDRWYAVVRLPSARSGERPFYDAAREQIEIQIAERIKRLGGIVGKLPESISLSLAGSASDDSPAIRQHRDLIERWPAMSDALEAPVEAPAPPAEFIGAFSAARDAGMGHIQAIRNSHGGATEMADWLEGIVDDVSERARKSLRAQ